MSRDSTFTTRITELFGIRHPLLLGGMMWLSDAALVAAMARAGAMGFITARSFPDAESFRAELRRCRELADGRHFGVNLTLSRQRAGNEAVAQLLQVALDEGVRHFETAGLPPGELLPRMHAAGALVIHKCAHIRHALSAERLGVDAVTLVGMEEGGHPGANQLPTFVNGAFALDRLKIPVVLGGGIGHGRQITAALALGADAVVLGSRFVAARECWAHDNYKQRIVAADEHCSVTVLSSLGDTWRVLDNGNAREVARLEREGARTHAEFGELIRGQRSRDLAYREGDPEQGMLSIGPAAGFSRSIESVQSIVDQLMDEAARAAARFRMVTVPIVFNSD
jgi:nitronate monooxygenase